MSCVRRRATSFRDASRGCSRSTHFSTETLDSSRLLAPEIMSCCVTLRPAVIHVPKVQRKIKIEQQVKVQACLPAALAFALRDRSQKTNPKHTRTHSCTHSRTHARTHVRTKVRVSNGLERGAHGMQCGCIRSVQATARRCCPSKDESHEMPAQQAVVLSNRLPNRRATPSVC